jgi:hypothetical protein
MFEQCIEYRVLTAYEGQFQHILLTVITIINISNITSKNGS